MKNTRKIFRTEGYRTRHNGRDCTVFWSLDPAFQQDGSSGIRQHFLYDKGSSSHLVSPTMPERDALTEIEKIEREAAGTLPRADANFVENMWIGSGYADAPHVSAHPLHDEQRREQAMKILKARKPPKLGL